MSHVKALLILFAMTVANPAFGWDSDKDMTLDDNDGDSPKVVVRDAAEETATLQKLAGNGAELRSTEGTVAVVAQGEITLKPSGDTSNSFSFETLSSNMMFWFQNAFTNKAGIRLNNTSGKLEYRDEDTASWSAMDDKTDWSISTETTDFSVTADDNHKFFLVDNLTTVTLPEASSVGANFMVSIKRIGVSTDVIINPSGGETIEGYDRVKLKERAARITLITDGTNWYEFDSKPNTVYYELSGSCPTGYVTVPANATFGITEDFCIAKYEMKNVATAAVSQAIGTPWVNISQTNSKSECEALGPEYHLVTNEEWMTVARNIENVATNWSGGSVGSGAINRGHSDDNPASALAANAADTQACEGTGETCSDTVWDNQRRTHILSNGEVIWDFTGDIWEWIDWNVVNDKASPQDDWIEINTSIPTMSMPQASFYPENAVYASSQGMGAYYPSINGSGGAALRSGAWNAGIASGIYALFMIGGPSGTDLGVGFRCAWALGGNP